MSTFYVHNLREGSRPAPFGYSSWIDYWEKKTGQKAGKCHYCGCNNAANDGGHVQLKNHSNDAWYIVPLCHYHNCQFGKDFYVTGPLVPVNENYPILW